MNALSYFFAAFLLFSGQAHGSNILVEYFSERFAQARVPTPEDFVEKNETIELACTEYKNDKRRKSKFQLVLLNESRVVDIFGSRVEYLVFANQGLMGVWKNRQFSYRLTWRIEDNGTWMHEWAMSEAGLNYYEIWWKNAKPSVIDDPHGNYRVINYTICNVISSRKTDY